jgi:enamine deaminase RidA (YjgF/YER057c/UK114 family)
MKTFHNPPDVHPPAGVYTHQVELRGPQRLLILAGQVGIRPDGTVPEDAGEQLEVALDNVARNLRAANMDMADVVKVTTYLVGDFDLTRLRQTVRARYGDHAPCSTLLYVAGLAAPAYRVEIEVWASRAD